MGVYKSKMFSTTIEFSDDVMERYMYLILQSIQEIQIVDNIIGSMEEPK